MACLPHMEISGLIHLEPRKFSDHRGFFSEVYNRQRLSELGFERDFVQDNQSLSHAAGTVRGMHFQSPPFAQDKLVRVLRGAILDVAVDLRVGSPTFGDHAAVELSARNWAQLLVPEGFAHGFMTLEPDTEVLYKVSAPYAPAHDHGFFWRDPVVGINWPMTPQAATLSEKDLALPLLSAIVNPFAFGAA